MSANVYLRRDGMVQIGDAVFKVDNMVTLNVMNNHVDHVQTVDLQLTLVRRIPANEKVNKT